MADVNELQSVLRFASKQCAFYQHLQGGEVSLTRFPVIDRRILRDHIDQFITAPSGCRDQLISALSNGGPAAISNRSEFPFSEDIYIEQTSGSSGVPLRLPKTKAERGRLSLGAWLRRRTFDPEISTANFLPLFHRTLDTPLEVSPFESSLENIQAFYAWVDRRQFRWLHAPPSLLAYHAAALRATGAASRLPYLKFVEVAGAPLGLRELETIKSVFGVQVINQYGTRESWAIGYAIQADAFEIIEGNVHVELLDDAGNPIDEANVEGAVTITSLALRLLPLVRYKTGDRGCWIEDGVGTARPSRKFRLAEDRDLNLLYHQGKIVSGNILFKEILHKLEHKVGYGAVKYIQIRRLNDTEWRLTVDRNAQAEALHFELGQFLRAIDPRIHLDLNAIADSEAARLVQGKPYLFVNESPPQRSPTAPCGGGTGTEVPPPARGW